MKKIIIFFLIIIAIITVFTYCYFDYQVAYRNAKKVNEQFDKYKDSEVQGSELYSLINKVVDSNEKNEVQKDKKGKYINNENNSINIDIKFIDNDVIYNMEKIYMGGLENFLTYYRSITFKCNEIQYHRATGKVKYMRFEQITQ